MNWQKDMNWKKLIEMSDNVMKKFNVKKTWETNKLNDESIESWSKESQTVFFLEHSEAIKSWEFHKIWVDILKNNGFQLKDEIQPLGSSSWVWLNVFHENGQFIRLSVRVTNKNKAGVSELHKSVKEFLTITNITGTFEQEDWLDDYNESLTNFESKTHGGLNCYIRNINALWFEEYKNFVKAMWKVFKVYLKNCS